MIQRSNNLTIKVDQAKVEELAKMFADMVKDMAVDTLEEAKSRVPVDTGALRDSLEMVETQEGYAVVSDSDYALSIELGTAKQSAQPFLRPALEKVVDSIGGKV